MLFTDALAIINTRSKDGCLTYITAVLGAAFQIKTKLALVLELFLISGDNVRHRLMRSVDITVLQLFKIEFSAQSRLDRLITRS